MLRESISRSYLSIKKDLPNDIKILEEEKPTGLAMREFLGVLEISKILGISDNSDWMENALNVLVPFSEKFMVIDVIVEFDKGENMGEVSTRMKVAISISLKKDDTSGKEGGISHNKEWTSDVRSIVRIGLKVKRIFKVLNTFCWRGVHT